MADTLKASKAGTSIAANQVGVMRRLIVVNDGGKTCKLINPVIKEQSGMQECQEACISFKDIQGIMARPEKIVIEALDENGASVTLPVEGDAVKHYCHAIDLLDGRIFIKEIIRFVEVPIDGE